MPPAAKDTTAEAFASRSTADHILDAAESLFAERGFSGTAMRDIAARVRLNAASLYNHFPSKQALYEAVLKRGLAPMFELLDELARSDWSPERHDDLTDALMDHLARRPHVPRLIAREAIEGGEHLSMLSREWLRPLFVRGIATFKESPTLRGWEEDELPLLLSAFHHMVLSHFALAPMLREVLDDDPLSKEALARQTRFLRKVVHRLIGAGGEERPRQAMHDSRTKPPQDR